MKNDRQVQIETEQLLVLRKNPQVSKKALKRAFELAFPEPDSGEWQTFLSRLFYSMGGALVLCGLLFFVQYHWAVMSYLQKCGLFGFSTLLCAAVAWRRGRRSIAGKVALTCASLLLGGFLIVASRVYETGEWHFVLSTWSALILPWCIAAEFAPLWLFGTGLFNVTLGAVCHFYFGQWFFQKHYFEIALLILNLTLLSTWEFGFWQGRTWMGRRWFPPILTLAALTPLTFSTAGLIVSWHGSLPQLFPLIPTIVASWAGLLFYYSQVRRDVSVLSLTLGSAVFIGTSLLWRLLVEANHPASLLVFSTGVVFQVSMALGLLRRLAPALPADPKAPPQETPDVRIWLGRLATEGFITSNQIEDMERAMRVHDEATLPWFVRAMTGVGAFIASIFLLLYLLLVGAVTEANGIAFGLGMCALACFVARVRSDFVTQACLSVSLCGQLMVWLVYAFRYNDPASTSMVMAGLELALAVLYPGAFGRFLSVNLTGLFLARWLTLTAPPMAIDVLVLVVGALVAYLWLRQHDFLSSSLGPAHGPVAMGSVSLLFALLLSTITRTGVLPEVGLVAALGLVVLAVGSAWAIGAHEKTLLGLALVGLISASAPGVMAAVLVFLLGFYRRNQTLQGLAILFLFAFGSAYYYHLALSLLVKSAVLLVSGCVFLVMAKSVD